MVWRPVPSLSSSAPSGTTGCSLRSVSVPDRDVRFVPAPGWPPVASEWLPESSWEPPGDWPAAPSDWSFYRGPYGEPVEAPAGHWTPPGERDGSTARESADSGRSAPPPATSASISAQVEDPASARASSTGRRVAGAVVAAAGLLMLTIASSQITELQHEKELNAFGQAVQTSDCTLASLNEWFGNGTSTATDAACKDQKPDPLDQAIEQTQSTQIAGGVVAVAGSVVLLWPARKRPV